MNPQIGDLVQVSSSDGLFTGILITTAAARPLMIDPENTGEWGKVPGEIEDIVVVRKGAIFE